MNLVHTVEQIRTKINGAHREGKLIGFVPTMGALHQGHMTLIKRAREQCDFVIVSIFVNPTQFGPTEDLDKYPRTLEADAMRCQEAGVDLVFAPSAAEMYPEGFDTWVEVNGPTKMLEGERRPGHFRGVTTVCCKLFHITQPDAAYFGKKDYQQLTVMKKMVRDLNMPMRIVPVDIVREPDGLAMSSRNIYLDPAQRKAAVVLSKSLNEAKSLYDSGERSAELIRSNVESTIKSEPLAEIDYVALVDADTLEPIETIQKPVVVLLAVRFGATRLIDNIVLE